ncbi:MAG: hypothetical protein ABI634_18810 [Acidobacteriota bacterium]
MSARGRSPDRSSWSRPWCPTPSRAVEIIGVTLLAIVVTLAIALPVLHAPSERIFGMAIVGRHHDPFTVMAQFAGPLVRGPYSQPLTDIPGALLARISGPVAAYNWLVLLTFPLSAAASYLLARHLALAPGSAALAAIAFAFSPFHIAQAAYHPHIAQTQWMPLYLLALWRCLDRPTTAAVGLLAASIAGVTLSNFYGGLIAAVITPVALAAYWWHAARDRPASSRRLAITLAALGGIALGGVTYAWATVPAALLDRAAIAFPRDDLFRYSAYWWSYLVPPVAHPVLGAFAADVWTGAGVREGLLEQQVTLGWGLVLLSLVAVFAWMIGHRHQRSTAMVPVLAATALVAVLCSLSPQWGIGSLSVTGPSAWLYNILPMFRAYARFGVVVQLTTALLAAIGAEYLWRSGKPGLRLACAALLMIAIAEYAVWPPSLWRDVLPTQAHRWVTRQAGPVRALDCTPLTAASQSVPWLSGGKIELHREGPDDCTEPNVAEKLSGVGYTHLIIQRNSAAGRWFATRPAVDGLGPAVRFREAEVFQVVAPPPSVYTADFTTFYPREYDADRTWRWMGPEASWRVMNRTTRPVQASLDVDVMAFHHARALTMLLDGEALRTLTIEPRRQIHHIGPLTLTPGYHQLVFQPAAAPTVADDLLGNGDERPLSFAIGTWHWRTDDQRR